MIFKYVCGFSKTSLNKFDNLGKLPIRNFIKSLKAFDKAPTAVANVSATF
jgi:hypothetical protein